MYGTVCAVIVIVTFCLINVFCFIQYLCWDQLRIMREGLREWKFLFVYCLKVRSLLTSLTVFGKFCVRCVAREFCFVTFNGYRGDKTNWKSWLSSFLFLLRWSVLWIMPARVTTVINFFSFFLFDITSYCAMRWYKCAKEKDRFYVHCIIILLYIYVSNGIVVYRLCVKAQIKQSHTYIKFQAENYLIFFITHSIAIFSIIM